MNNLPDLLESQLKDCHHVLEITNEMVENLSAVDYQQIELFLSQRGFRIEALGDRFRTLEKFLRDGRTDNGMDESRPCSMGVDEWIEKIRDKIEEILVEDKILMEKARDRSLYLLGELEKLRDGKRAIKSYHGVESIPKFLDKKV